MLTTLTIALWSCLTMNADECDGFYFSEEGGLINNHGIPVTVTGLVDGTEYRGDIVIPASFPYPYSDYYSYAVTSIGYGAFEGCTGLTSITIPESVTYIGSGAFEGCIGELYVNCNIPEMAFSRTGFTKVVIGEGVTYIGEYAFEGCTGLTSITIPESVTYIGDHAFEGCSNLSSIIVEEGNLVYDSRENCNAIIKTETNELISGCQSTIIPESVTSIGEWAFCGCDNLTSITIPESVTSIGGSAFSGCSSLTTITIPESVTSIGDDAFGGCGNLKTIVVKNEAPPTIESNSLGDEPLTVAVPWQSMEAYRNADYWNLHDFIPLYTITYMVDDEVFKTDKFTSGSTLTPPVKGGYTFSSDEMPETMPAEDIIINGTVTVNSYDLIYMVDGEVFKTESVAYGSEITLTNDIPTKEGHAFSEWILPLSSYETLPIDIASNADAMLYSNAPYNGSNSYDRFNGWHVLFDGDANTYFHSDYSGANSADGLDHYLRVDMGEGKSVKDFTFTYTVRGDVTSYTPRKIVVEGSNDADGEYTAIAILTNLPTNGGAVYESDVLGNGNAYRYIRYRVEGQPFFYFAEFGMSGGVIVILRTLTMPAHDMVVNASFTKNKYKITFKVDDEVISEEMVTYGSEIVAPNPAKEGHTLNWDEIPATMPAEDITINGSYSINSYTLTYRVDGVAFKTVQVMYGSVVVPIEEIPTKEGYTFSGWNMREGVTMPARNAYVNALFTINQYKVTFKVGDEVISEELLDYGSIIHAPQGPEKEGHSFSWGEVDSYVPAHDVTYEGNYSINSYTLTYVIEGEIVKELSVPYGTAIASLERPVKEGYTFSLIGEIPETMPAEDTPLNGTFTINKYRVIFALGGVVKKMEVLEYGTTIVAPTFPEKEGYTLTWSEDIPATVPANDVYYNATYVPNIYQVYYFVGFELVYTADVPYGERIPEYIYDPEEGEGEFLYWAGDDYESMPAHEVYFTAVLGEVDTDVRQLLQNAGELIIYDLQGRRVVNTDNLKGIYIVNGKRVVIK